MMLQDLHESIHEDQVPKIVQALSGQDLEMVWHDDDGESVMGPDGEQGWFNSGTTSTAVRRFDTATVRAVVNMLWFFQRVARGRDLDREDQMTLSYLAKKFVE